MAFRTPDTIVQYDYTDPDSVITVRLHEGQPSEVDFGQTEMDPEVTKPIFPRYKAMLAQQGHNDLIHV